MWDPNCRQLRRLHVSFLSIAGMTLTIALLMGQALSFSPFQGMRSQGSFQAMAQASSAAALPALRIHPLPQFLENWHDLTQQGDYFDQIQLTEVGYLIWSEFPVRVYVEPLSAAHAGATGRSQVWLDAVQQAIVDWQAYFSLEITEQPDQAQITIRPQMPPLRRTGGTLRSHSAETRYTLYRQTHRDGRSPQLVHRFALLIRPSQTASYLRAAVRHELGHALGLWGHSPDPADALYFAQVRDPASISRRDINTLRRVYQQPTRLGWSLPLESSTSLHLS